jgi:hypothetical protein
MNDADYSSDTSDEDYVPDVAGEELSEEDDSGDEEDFLKTIGSDHDDIVTDNKKTLSYKCKRKIKSSSLRKKAAVVLRKREGGIKLEDDCEAGVSSVVEHKVMSNTQDTVQQLTVETNKWEEVNKKKADDLWADFMKDVGSASLKSNIKSTETTMSSSASKPASSQSLQSKSSSSTNTVKVTKEYDFAGETVRVVKEVAADSQEAKEAGVTLNQLSAPAAIASHHILPTTTTVIKRPAASVSGLGSVLEKIGKKSKISVLEKSKIDWDGFKAKEGISDELKIHNRGKEGYLERQAFLQRTDYRQFELERNLRLNQSSSLPPSAKH